MNFNLETIEKLISNSFEIDCIDIRLTQKIENDPLLYTGPGTIYQDENGKLLLKAYSKITDIKKGLSHQVKYHTPGKILTEDEYFNLKAIDMSGTEWIADNVWVDADVWLPARGQIIRSSLREIETIEEGSTTKNDYLFIIVPGSYEIPCNEKEDLPNGGWRLNRSVFTSNNIDFELKKLDECLIINASSAPGCMKEDTCVKFLEALSIITGFIIRPVVIKNTQKDHAVLKLKSVASDYSNRKFLTPFKHSTPGDLQSFSCFIGNYLEAIDAPFSGLFGFYHKINRAWQSDIENSSLSLGVAIEWIMKTYFWELGVPDDEITQQANEAKEKLDNVDFGKRIKYWLLSSINGLLNNSSSKGALYQMVKDGLLSKKMADEWVKLRNRSVHPDRLNEDPPSFQKYLDQIYTCIALFYRLLFAIIRYKGSYVDYSEEGWPDKTFQQQAE